MLLSFSFCLLIYIPSLGVAFVSASFLAFLTTALSCQNTLTSLLPSASQMSIISTAKLQKALLCYQKKKKNVLWGITFSYLMLLWTVSISPAISRQEAQLFAFLTSFIRVHTLPPDTLVEQLSSYTKTLWRCINISDHVRSTNVQKLPCIAYAASRVLHREQSVSECSSVWK